MNFKKMNAWLMAVSLTATTVGANGMPLYIEAAQLGMKSEVNEETLRENKLQFSTEAKNYDVNEVGTITKYTGNEADIVIPAKKHERQIYGIGQEVFQNRQNIQSVVIPKGITVIKKDAFFNCTSLKSVVMSSTVTEIEAGAFQNCINLERIDLSKTSVTKIPERAFQNCRNLKEVILPEGILSIEADAFNGCGQLTSINIASLKKLDKLGSGAFGNCISLSEMVIPESVTRIAGGAFANCISLQSITIPARVSELGLAVLEGSRKVTVKSAVNSLAYDYATEKNLKFEAVSEEVLVSKIELLGEAITTDSENVKNLTVETGKSILMDIWIPADATNKNVLWECSKEGIVSISKEGIVTGLKKGFTAVTVKAEGGVNKTDYIEIHVS